MVDADFGELHDCESDQPCLSLLMHRRLVFANPTN
jgi:hypothetical protein